MKKALLTFAITVMLACALTICVSAAIVTDEIKYGYFPKDAVVETIDGIEATSHIHKDILDSYPNATDARIKVSCTCEKGTHIYPTYYVTNVSEKEYFRFNYTEINSKNPCGAKYNKHSLIALELPNGYTNFDGNKDDNNYGVRGSTSLEYVDMSGSETLINLSSANLREPFCDCAALKYVKMSKVTTRIPGWTFIRCKELLTVEIPIDSQIEHIGNQAFKNCPKLTALYLPDSVKTIGFLNDGSTLMGNNKNDDTGSEGDCKGTFYGCTSLFFVNNPEDTQRPSVYYMPKNLEKTTGELFKNLDQLNDTVVFGENFICLNNGFSFAQIENARTFVFKGDFTREDSKFEYSCEMTNVIIYFTNENVKDGDFIKYATSWNGTTPSNCYAYICASGERAPLVKQANNVADAVLNFSSDGFVHAIEMENVGVYYNDYFANGYGIHKCFCNERVTDSEAKLAPVFESRGFSVPEDESRGAYVTQGIKVNRQMLSLLGDDVDFGIVVDVNLEGYEYDPIADGALTRSLLNSEYSYFDIKVSGIPEEYRDTAIVLCGYIAVGEDIYYLDGAKTGRTVVGISYNAILNKGNKEG